MNSPNDLRRKRPKGAPPQPLIEDAVSEKLRSYYAEIAQEKVPQHLLDLLDSLDQSGTPPAQPPLKK